MTIAVMPRMFNQCKSCFFGFDHPTTARCSSNFDIYPTSYGDNHWAYFPSITKVIPKEKIDSKRILCSCCSHSTNEKLPVPVSNWLDKFGCSRNQYRRILNGVEYNEQFDGPLEDYKDRAVRIANRGR